jgi:hypothetical protein
MTKDHVALKIQQNRRKIKMQTYIKDNPQSREMTSQASVQSVLKEMVKTRISNLPHIINLKKTVMLLFDKRINNSMKIFQMIWVGWSKESG